MWTIVIDLFVLCLSFYTSRVNSFKMCIIQSLFYRGIGFSAIGHRVVHGGETFHGPVKITEQVKDEIKQLADLAPLHNPANLLGIEVMENLYPSVIQTAVFDTSFHQTIPEKGAHETIYKL